MFIPTLIRVLKSACTHAYTTYNNVTVQTTTKWYVHNTVPLFRNVSCIQWWSGGRRVWTVYNVSSTVRVLDYRLHSCHHFLDHYHSQGVSLVSSSRVRALWQLVTTWLHGLKQLKCMLKQLKCMNNHSSASVLDILHSACISHMIAVWQSQRSLTMAYGSSPRCLWEQDPNTTANFIWLSMYFPVTDFWLVLELMCSLLSNLTIGFGQGCFKPMQQHTVCKTVSRAQVYCT